MSERKAYLAGFFDGEGWIGIYPHKSMKTGWRIQVGASQVIKQPLIILKEEYGGSLILHEMSKKNPKYQDCWRWILTRRRDVKRFLSDMQPYLQVKNNKCENALNLFEQWGI